MRLHRQLFVLVFAFIGAQTLLAHHSFAMFDTAKTTTIDGKVTKFEWQNPHVYIDVNVTDEKGAVKLWTIELGSPSILQQGGWKFSDVKVGDKVVARINPLRSGENGGLLVQITLPSGKTLGNGPGRGPAAPAAGQ